jgi:hypothetical protein
LKKLSILSVALFVILGACSPKAEKKIQVTNPENGEKTEVAVSKSLLGDKETTITNKENGATLTVKEGSLPKEFPQYITLYQGAKNVATMQANEGDGTNKVMMVSFTTNDDTTKVIEFYRKQLAANGYTEKGNTMMGSMGMTSLVNEKTEEALQIVAAKSDNKDETAVQLIFAKQPKK